MYFGNGVETNPKKEKSICQETCDIDKKQV